LSQTLPEPARETRLVQRAAGDAFHDAHGITRREVEPISIVDQEQARDHPGGSLISVDETMIVGEREGGVLEDRRKIRESLLLSFFARV
jgi:hypothetical protein